MRRMLLVGDKETVAKWMMARIPDSGHVNLANHGFWDAWGTIVEDDDGTRRLIGGCIYLNLKRGEKVSDIEMFAAGEPGWLDRRLCQAYFAYPFKTLGATRITLIVSKRNKKTRGFVQRLGFVEEGNAREGMSNGDDAMIYGMLRRECRWIREKEPAQ